ncbi:MAG: DUF2062 domain-containing protein [Alphaproteobacteria bacterium]|nr:DUF2062 domain-containing protein [Alphaproteobacteria bacterium]
MPEKKQKTWLHKLTSIKATPYEIACGVACGVAVTFSPFVGIHFILAIALAFVLKGNIWAGALGTAAGNPWTFPFIWPMIYYSGKFLVGAGENASNESFLKVFEKSMRALISFDFSQFGSDVWPIFYPMLIGCIPYCIVAWAVTYYMVKKMLAKFNAAGGTSK